MAPHINSTSPTIPNSLSTTTQTGRINQDSSPKADSSPRTQKQVEDFLQAFQTGGEYDSEADAPGEDDPDVVEDAPAKSESGLADTVRLVENTPEAVATQDTPMGDASVSSSTEHASEEDPSGEPVSRLSSTGKITKPRTSRKSKAVAPTTTTTDTAIIPAAAAAAVIRTYNAGVGTAVASNVPLPSMVIGAIELLTYFPHHVRSPDLLFRLYRAHWSMRYIAKAQLHARGTLTRAELERRDATMRQKVSVAGKEKFGPDFTTTKYQRHADLLPVTLDHYKKEDGFPNGILEHYDVSDARPSVKEKPLVSPATLQQLAQGVVNPPQGEHRGLLTQAIEWAAQQSPSWVKVDGSFYTTDDVLEIVKTQGLRLPPMARTAQWDLAGAVFVQNVQGPSD